MLATMPYHGSSCSTARLAFQTEGWLTPGISTSTVEALLPIGRWLSGSALNTPPVVGWVSTEM